MAFTKVRGRGVTTTDNYTVGVITATKFVGPITGGGGGIQVGLLTATGLDINGDADISGNLTVGGDFTTLNTTLREVELLHVDANSSATAGIITQRGSGDILNLFDNNSEVLTVKDGGNVGIGTENPSEKLHVSALGASDEPTIKVSGENSSIWLRTAGSSGSFPTGGSGNDGEILYFGGDFRFGVGTASKNLIFFNGNAYNEAMRIDSSRRLLIGHNASRDVFKQTGVQISGNTTDNAGLSIYSTYNGNGGPNLVLGHSRNGNKVTDGTILGDITFVGHDNTDLNSRASIIRSIMTADGSDNSLYADLIFYTKRNAGGYPDESLRITSGGGLQFRNADTPTNNNEPALILNHAGGWQFYASSDTSTHNNIIFGTNSVSAGERLRIQSDGSVGIGTDDASWGLSGAGGLVVGDGSGSQAITLYGTSNGDISFGDAKSGTARYSGLIRYNHTDDYMAFRTATVERLRIDDYGVLRVGNTHDQTTSSNTKRIALGGKGGIWGWVSGQIDGSINLADNYYWDGANNRAIEAADAAYLALRLGSLRFGTTDSTPSAGGVTGLTEKFRITKNGNVNINGNFTQTTYPVSITTGNVNKKISFGAAAHGSLSNEGAGIFFSRQNDGSAELSGLFSHSNGGFGIATRETMTFHTGGGSTYGSAVERLRIAADGRVSIGNNPTVDSNTNLHIEEASGECGVVIEGNTGGAGAYLLLRNNSTSSNPRSYIGGVDSGGQGTSQIEFHNLDNGANEGQLTLHTRPSGGSMTERLKITSAGKAVFSEEIETPQDYPNFRPRLDFNFLAEKKLDPRITYYRTGSASYVDEFGIVKMVADNVPRFDHDSETGESKGLLIETSTTSRLTQSSGNDSYSHFRQTDRGETIKGPDGVENSAREYTVDSNGSTGGSTTIWASQAIGMADPTSVSCFLKITRGTTMAFRIFDNNNNQESEKITISGGAITDGSYATVVQSDPGGTEGTTSYERYPNGWVRLKWEGASNNANATSYLQLYIYDHAAPNGDGDNIGYGVWGFQVENGEVCTSPIYKPTTAAVTRGADTVTIEGEEFSDFYNKEQGTLLLSASYIEDIRTSAAVTIDDTSNESEYTEIGYRAGGSSTGRVSSYTRTDAGGDQAHAQHSSAATKGNEFKVAFGYKDNDYASSANGSAVITDTSGTTSKVFDRLRFSDVDTVGVSGSGYYRRFIYYPKRLPNSQLVTLTS